MKIERYPCLGCARPCVDRRHGESAYERAGLQGFAIVVVGHKAHYICEQCEPVRLDELELERREKARAEEREAMDAAMADAEEYVPGPQVARGAPIARCSAVPPSAGGFPGCILAYRHDGPHAID